jgi:ABC-type transporter Mla subunit MlaD
MMPGRKDTFQVGVVALASVAIFFALLLWISRGVSGATQTLTVRFESSSSMPTLAPGSDVIVGGQKVGKVSSAALRKERRRDAATGRDVEAFFVYVTAEIQAQLELRSDCRVIAEGPPLGGDGVMKIDLGDSGERLKPGQVIIGSEPAGFAAVLASLQAEFDAADPRSLLGQIKTQLDPEQKLSLLGRLSQSMSDLNAITASLSRQLAADQKASLMARVQEIADNISTATAALRSEFGSEKPEVLLGKIHLAMDAINEGLSGMNRILRTNEPALQRTVAHVETAAGNIAAQTDASRKDSLMAHFAEAGAQLNRTLADINAVTAAGRDVMVLNQENISRMLVNFKEASDHLKSGVKYVLRHPWRLLNPPSTTEIRQLAVFDAARNFADAATRIDDAASQLRALAELNNGSIPSDHPELLRLEGELKQTQEKYRQAESDLWRQLGMR